MRNKLNIQTARVACFDLSNDAIFSHFRQEKVAHMTRSAGAASARFRQRKLSTRQTVQIVREDQVDKVDEETQRNVPKVETGVEKGEEVVSLPMLSQLYCARLSLPFS